MKIEREDLIEVTNMSKDESMIALGHIQNRLLPGVEMLFATLTGSRAFGWGGDVYDRDVKCVVAPVEEEFWDTFHIGINGYDLNGEELEHMFRRMRWRWTVFEDLSNPIWIHPKFDHDKFLSFASVDNVVAHRYTIQLEKIRAETKPAVRAALHCYRQHMEPIHFLTKGEIEINVMEINKWMKLEQLPILADMYKTREFREVDYKAVFEEMDFLVTQLDDLIEGRASTYDEDAHEAWKQEVRDIFNYN